ncbi:MAG: hypothetical protein IPI88_16250 [Chitinophagaceae bacterium]|nr:hypothetical protein [Chitinophagaceae bacterium]
MSLTLSKTSSALSDAFFAKSSIFSPGYYVADFAHTVPSAFGAPATGTAGSCIVCRSGKHIIYRTAQHGKFFLQIL